MVGFGRNDFRRSQNFRFDRSDFRCRVRPSKCKNVLRRSDEAVVTSIVITRIVASYIHLSNHTASAISERYRVTSANSTVQPQACQNRRPLFWLICTDHSWGIARLGFNGTPQTLVAGGIG